MKILHLISQHPESTGSGFYLQNVIKQATAAGHQNFLIAGISGSRLPQLNCIDRQSCRFVHFGQDGLDFTIPGMSDVMPYPSSKFSELSAAQIEVYEKAFRAILGQAVGDFSPDIIHSHHLWLASSVARQYFPHIPMVTSCHSSDLRQFHTCPLLRGRVLPQCRKIDRILALSRDQQKEIRQIYGISERIDIVGGGYDETLFTLAKKENTPPVQMLYGGKISFAKGVDLLIRTFHSIDRRGIHLHLAGSGTGSEAKHCLELAAKAGGSVTVHGRIGQKEMARLMGSCHVFILPSFYEGVPLVLLEALASGCRIISTDLPGCRELLGDADQDLVEFIRLPVMKKIDRPGRAELPDLEVRLKEAIQSTVTRVRLSPTPDPANIEKLTTQFGWKTVFEKISQAYGKVIRG